MKNSGICLIPGIFPLCITFGRSGFFVICRIDSAARIKNFTQKKDGLLRLSFLFFRALPVDAELLLQELHRIFILLRRGLSSHFRASSLSSFAPMPKRKHEASQVWPSALPISADWRK